MLLLSSTSRGTAALLGTLLDVFEGGPRRSAAAAAAAAAVEAAAAAAAAAPRAAVWMVRFGAGNGDAAEICRVCWVLPRELGLSPLLFCVAPPGSFVTAGAAAAAVAAAGAATVTAAAAVVCCRSTDARTNPSTQGQSAVVDVVGSGNGRYCSPLHRVPCNSRD